MNSKMQLAVRRCLLILLALLCVGLTSCGSSKTHESGIAGHVTIVPDCVAAQKQIPRLTCSSLLNRDITLQVLSYSSHYICCTAQAPSFKEVVHTGLDGAFQVKLPPGTYTIQGLPRNQAYVLPIEPPSSHSVIVHTNHVTDITVPYMLSQFEPSCSPITGACPPSNQPSISVSG
jgi:hypothetical protein